jgi:three-Cys-motif partner protein
MTAKKLMARDGFLARAGGSWTWTKLGYLRKYAKAFMVAMGAKRDAGRWHELVFLDLLCGPGIDIIDGGEEVDGSPLIALKTTPQFNRLYLGDLQRANIAALRRRIPSSELPRVDLKQGDCHDRAKSIVASLPPRTLGLAFVDPQGLEVRFSLFETLAARPIDILYLFPSGIGIKRNLSLFAKQAESLMDDLMGNRDWRKLAVARQLVGEQVDIRAADKTTQVWVHAFCERMKGLGYLYSGAAPVLRNDQNAPMFHLLFFSKDKAGLTLWDGIGKIEPGGQRRLL